ncbi:MBOAT family O-acyltransferase [Flavobacterium anhuiense]|uniref:MBOAT family O-acyltransferase n=1 Tax=Flavobacterium anhuiense TaxID=459526 RepID=UPI000E6D3AB6|nr:MBOAT family O-acyltransferase [Flavobacterium anhuiense]
MFFNSLAFAIFLPIVFFLYWFVFNTFHGLSYVIDIYYKRIKAEYNFIDYSLFVSYFPLLVAGPIERATHLLPQVKIKREFNFEKAKEGFSQIIWGLFKKVVIADTCAIYANAIFDHYNSMDSLSLILGTIYFAFQIYGDFSGYSDIALGVSKLFGIDLLRNFNYPYFSRDIAEFWRRWHISLSSWFRDYLYIPLGGSKGGLWMKIRNTFIIFIVSGFWHGANWTYLMWGFINAIYFLPLLLLRKNRNNTDEVDIKFRFSSLKTLLNILFTFGLTCFAWIFFRAENIFTAFNYIQRIFEFNIDFQNLKGQISFTTTFVLLYLVLLEWNNRKIECPLNGKLSKVKILAAIVLILLLGEFNIKNNFIYFQF